MPAEELDAIWSPMHLERLARTYWKYLSRVTLGLIRVVYTPTERAVVLLVRPFVLLRFHAPEYEMDDERGIVRWRIRDGILVAQQGRGGDGYLEIDVRAAPSDAPGPRAHPRRGRDRLVLPRASPSGSRAGSTRTPSRASTCSSRTGSCARSRGSSWRSRRSAASRPQRNGDGSAAPAGQRRRHAVARRRRARRRGRGWRGAALGGAGSAAGVAGERAQLRAVVAGLDPPHGARARAHDERLRARAARALVAHALEHVAVGHARGGEEHVVAA